MLSLATILIAFEALCHVALALLHLWHRLEPSSLWHRLGLLPLSHQTRDTLVGLLYAGMAVGLLAGAIAYVH